jgi:hypothetical protein
MVLPMVALPMVALPMAIVAVIVVVMVALPGEYVDEGQIREKQITRGRLIEGEHDRVYVGEIDSGECRQRDLHGVQHLVRHG